MKKLHLIITFLMVTTCLIAQRDQTIFNASSRVGGFGGPIFEFSELGQGADFETARGGGGGLIVGDFFVGGYGIGDISLREIIDNETATIDIGHGGLWLGVVPLQHYALHPYTSLRFGWGAADIRFENNRFSTNDRFFVIHPEAGIEVNIFRWFRVAGTAGYQWYNGLDDSPQVESLDLNNFRFGLTLRFGGFGRKKNW